MTEILSFMMLVHGVAYDARLNSATCTCNAGEKQLCAVSQVAIPTTDIKIPAVVVLDLQKQPTNGKAHVLCLRGRK